jgi:hypothetical protein
MDEMPPINNRPPDPFVAARVNDPKVPPTGTFTVSGLLGDSDREGRRRLYLNTKLDFWVEFRTEDVVAVESVGPDQPPFLGLDATRVTVTRDARLEYVRSQVAGGDQDPFSLQAVGRPMGPLPMEAETWEAECAGPSFAGDCGTEFCPTDNDCPSGWTVCKPATCRVTERATCDTCRTCEDATCVTCRGRTCVTCGDATCVTCRATCVTCRTCGATCSATCAGTCARTCRFTCVPDVCETVLRCPTELQTHCNTCRCRTDIC